LKLLDLLGGLEGEGLDIFTIKEYFAYFLINMSSEAVIGGNWGQNPLVNNKSSGFGQRKPMDIFAFTATFSFA
jgi:hypothetical protein